jgi:hypothetical protein
MSQHPATPAELSFDWRLLKVLQVLCGGMLAPLLSLSTVVEVAEFPSVAILLLFILCLVFVGVLRRVPRDVAAVILGLLAIVPMYHGVHALSRAYGYAYLELSLGGESRVAFITILFPMMVWFVLLSHASNFFSRTICRQMLGCIVFINVLRFLVVARDVQMEQQSAWPEFQSWLTHARQADGVRGSTAQLPVMTGSFEWARLSCVRKEFSIECRVGQGNGGNEAYSLPVAGHK